MLYYGSIKILSCDWVTYLPYSLTCITFLSHFSIHRVEFAARELTQVIFYIRTVRGIDSNDILHSS